MKLILSFTLPFFALDQVTKWLVLRHIGQDESIPVIPGFFNLVQVHNTGAAFGMLHDSNLFFILLALGALVVLAVLGWRGFFRDRLSRIGAALLAAGVLGNLCDRLIHHFVVDFLDFILPWYGHWPSFNVADSCICVAAALFIIASFREDFSRKRAAANA